MGLIYMTALSFIVFSYVVVMVGRALRRMLIWRGRD